MKSNKYFLIGNPKRKRFSFGYSNFLGDFGVIDLIITIWIITLIVVFWISFKILIALASTFILFCIWIILVKQFGNEKSYDFVFNFLKYRFKFKEMLNIDENINSSIILEVDEGFNLMSESNDYLQKIINKLDDFIKNYYGSFKIINLNSNWNLQEHFNHFKKNYVHQKSEALKLLQSNLYDYLYALKKSKLNNRIFFIFEKPNDKQLQQIKAFNFDLKLKQCDSHVLLNLKKQFFYKAKESWNKIETLDKKLIISKAKFQRNVSFGWLINLFSDPQFSFSLEINSINATEKIKFIKRLNKQKINYRVANEIESAKKEWISQANKKLLEEVILYNEELKLISLITIFEEDKLQNYQSLELKNQYKSNFKLYKSYFNQQKDWNNFWGWNNGVFPTTNETIANAFPYLNLSYIDKKGFFLGRIEKRYPFIFNSWQLTNQTNFHTMILGNSGSGKTCLMKYLLAGELVLNNQQTIILDPHNEFTFLKATEIDLSNISFNPLVFWNINHNNFDEMIQKKIFFLKEFFTLFYQEQFNQKMAQDIQTLLLKIEKNLKNKKEIIIKNQQLCMKDLKINHFLLEPIVNGIYQIFNQPETFSLKDQIIVINLKNLFLIEEQTKNLILFLFINRLKEVIYSNQNSSKKIALYIDEAAKFLRSKFLLKQISPLFSEARKFNTKITIATQNFADIFNPINNQILLTNILANCSNMFIGYLKNDQKQLLDTFLKEGGSEPLSIKEHQHINKKQGHFLFIKDNKRYAFESLYDKKINAFLKIKT